MRILALSLKNLNSLHGEWHIDFRHPAYADNGIFAITGQTGAGKSTILDAICLALYGQTPRLSELTQSRNDLMSRQTGECWAKVIFSTKGKTYLAEWSQKKAHNKHDGKLQSPKHSISDYQSDEEGDLLKKQQGNILEEKAKATKPKIQAITGMDFHQFTRSMLLAQGSFAAFLQAKSEERSEILEQITGSEIYSEISIRVNAHRSETKKALENLQFQQAGMAVLTDEEVQQLIENKKQFSQKADLTKQKIDTLNQLKHWQNAVQTTQIEQSQNQHNLTQLQQEIANFAPQRTRLNLAQKALEVAGEYAKLQHDRQQYAKLWQNQNDLQNQLPILQKQLTEIQQQLTHAKTTKTQTETAWQTAQPKLNQAKKLAVQIDQLQQQLYKDQQQHSAHSHEKISLATTLENARAELSDLQHTQMQQRHEQASLTNHVALPEVVANLRMHLITLESRQTQLRTLRNQQSDSQKNLTKLAESLHYANGQLNGLNRENAETQRSLNSLTQRLQEALAGKTSEDWYNHKNRLLQGRLTLTQLKQKWQEINDLTQEKTTLEQTQNQTQTAFTTIQSRNIALEHDYQKQTQIVDTLIKNQLLQAKIKNLESERNALRDGEPCPLCGSIDHPFVTQTFDDNESELTIAKIQLKTLEKQKASELLEQNSLSRKIQEIQSNIIKIEKILNNQCEQLKKLSIEFSQIFVDENFFDPQDKIIVSKIYNFSYLENQAVFQANFAQILANLQHLMEEKFAIVSVKMNQIQSLPDSIERLKLEYETRKQQYDELEKKQQNTINQQALETQNISHFSQQIEKLGQDLSQLFKQLNQLINPFSQFLPDWREIEAPFIFNITHQNEVSLLPNLLAQTDFVADLALDYVVETLTQRQQYYQQLEQKIRLNEQAITALQTRLQQQTEVYEKNAQILAQKTQQLTQDTQILTQRKVEKFELIEEMDIEQEEQRLNDDLNFAQNAYFSAEKTLQKTEQNLHILQEGLSKVTQELTQLNGIITHQKNQLTQRWQRLGFGDETAFLNATLAELERQQLVNTARQLDDRLHFLTQQQGELQQKFLALQSSPLCAMAQGQTPQQIDEQLQQVTQALEHLQQQLGAILQKLNHDQQIKISQGKLFAQIQQQTKIWQDWHNLYELIGSSDGKKFRNFAQGLTFNVMINHANAQLGQMSDRYLLIADTQNPLELNVIDNYQGGEVRTSKNLSGGESFIVSLALALGLSSMASRQMQVDSLFLDEGFGTLDAEALDTALDTLTSLQQSGKLIGVISHVQALKDRITTQIVVEKVRGGVSEIAGAGVQKVGK